MLVDSLERSIQNFLETIRPYTHHKISQKEIYDHYLGPTEEDDVLLLAKEKKISKKHFDNIRKEFVKLKQDNLQKIPLFKKIIDVILYARNNNITQVLVTGRDHDSAKKIIENKINKIGTNSLITYLDYFLAGDEYKGKLDAFTLIQKKCGVDANNILVLGDEIKDIETARTLQFIEGACLWGTFVREELIRLNPTIMFEKPEEVIEFLKK